MTPEKKNSNTVPKQLKPFVKGDPRINRNGRPKSFDFLRSLAQKIAMQEIDTKKGKMILAEAILHSLASDKKFQVHFLEIAFGKVPQAIQLSGALGIEEQDALRARAIELMKEQGA